MTIQNDFKNALASWATGVAVVTTKARGLLYGVTVSSFTSISLEPPIISVSLSNRNRLHLMIQDAEIFAVSILAEGMEDASNYFAKSGREPTEGFVEVDGYWTEAGVPVISGAMAHLVCKVHDVVTWGDHTVVAGEVVEAASADGKKPLIYFDRAYRTVTD